MFCCYFLAKSGTRGRCKSALTRTIASLQDYEQGRITLQFFTAPVLDHDRWIILQIVETTLDLIDNLNKLGDIYINCSSVILFWSTRNNIVKAEITPVCQYRPCEYIEQSQTMS